MTQKRDIYFQFKTNIQKDSTESIYLKDIIELYCNEDIRDFIENIKVPSTLSEGNSMVVYAIQVIQLINQHIDGVRVHHLGEGKALIEPRLSTGAKRPAFLTGVMVFLSVMIVFFGAALAVMYFHSDVDMNEAHQNIYQFFTGKSEDRPLIVSIPYSIGIGLGIALFFDVFSVRKRNKMPSPLELELYRYEKDVYSYIRDEEEKEGTT